MVTNTLLYKMRKLSKAGKSAGAVEGNRDGESRCRRKQGGVILINGSLIARVSDTARLIPMKTREHRSLVFHVLLNTA